MVYCKSECTTDPRSAIAGLPAFEWIDWWGLLSRQRSSIQLGLGAILTWEQLHRPFLRHGRRT
jgi:hypothetical protein